MTCSIPMYQNDVSINHFYNDVARVERGSCLVVKHYKECHAIFSLIERGLEYRVSIFVLSRTNSDKPISGRNTYTFNQFIVKLSMMAMVLIRELYVKK